MTEIQIIKLIYFLSKIVLQRGGFPFKIKLVCDVCVLCGCVLVGVYVDVVCVWCICVLHVCML
jgi:hypothetical protein